MYTLNKLLSNSISGDSLFVSYSGHGTYINDLNGDELDGQDELWVPIDATSIKSCISDDELNSIITTNLKPQTTLFVLSDSCFSGTVLDLKYNYKSLCVLKPGKKINKSLYVPMDWTDNFSFSLEKSKDLDFSGNFVCKSCKSLYIFSNFNR